MSRKSPSRIRKDLEAARNRVNVLIGVLRQNESERRWGLGAECLKAIESLQKLLHENQTPHEYKVAVIGRFKAGKSSFVNVLLDRRLHTPAGNQPVLVFIDLGQCRTVWIICKIFKSTAERAAHNMRSINQ